MFARINRFFNSKKEKKKISATSVKNIKTYEVGGPIPPSVRSGKYSVPPSDWCKSYEITDLALPASRSERLIQQHKEQLERERQEAAKERERQEAAKEHEPQEAKKMPKP